METWQEWVAVAVSFTMSLILLAIRNEKLRTDRRNEDQEKLNAQMSERLVRLESQALTEAEVRNIMADSLAPLIAETREQRQELHKLGIVLAGLPKRNSDET